VAGRVVACMRKALVALTLLLAGCTAAPGDAGDDPTVPTVATLVDALVAYDAGQATANLERLGQLDVGGSEVDTCGHYLYADSGDHVDIVDISDPTVMTIVGSFASPVSIEDVKVSDDCRWMFIGNDEEGSIPPVHDVGVPALAPAGDGGIYVVDLADPSKPTLASSLGVGPRRGPHMVYYHRTADGRELVFGANADISINEFDRATGTLRELSRYQADLVFAYNRDPQVFDVYYQGYAHDMVVMDEADGTPMMYVANWDAGLRIVDLSDPLVPVEVGGWNAFPEGHAGNLHTVSTDIVAGRRITVGTVEVGFYVVGGYHYAQGTEKSILYVWDTTDPSQITLLGTWENPDRLPAGRDQEAFNETITSTHNFQFEDGRVYLAHYGLGVWVLDVSTPDAWSGPTLLAYHMEEGDNVWDVVLEDGVIYSSGAAGVVALHFPLDVMGPAGIDSRA
jgi:hypothetical protein